MRGLVDENGEIIKTEEEEKNQQQITEVKRKYQSQYNELKDLKSEIERIQALLERCREKLQKDFE
jgi:kinesin family protein 6/9